MRLLGETLPAFHLDVDRLAGLQPLGIQLPIMP